MRYQLRYIRTAPRPRPACIENDSRIRHPAQNGVLVDVLAERIVYQPDVPVRVERTTEYAGAIGAVGSALPSHGRGHQFESGIAHHSVAGKDVAFLTVHHRVDPGELILVANAEAHRLFDRPPYCVCQRERIDEHDDAPQTITDCP